MGKLAKLIRYFTAEDELEEPPKTEEAQQPEAIESDTESSDKARKQ